VFIHQDATQCPDTGTDQGTLARVTAEGADDGTTTRPQSGAARHPGSGGITASGQHEERASDGDQSIGNWFHVVSPKFFDPLGMLDMVYGQGDWDSSQARVMGGYLQG
jgi:hypothetical protein